MTGIDARRLDRLYSYPLLRRPVAVARAIPMENVFTIFSRPEKIEPEYENYPDIWEKYFRPTVREIGRYFRENIGRNPYFGDLRLRFEKLPTYLGFFKKGNEIIMKIFKMFGYYNPETKEVGVDPVVAPELQDPERPWLKKYTNILKMKRVLGEELIHSEQDISGAIKKYYKKYGEKAREYIEGAAAYISDKIFGETGIYQRAKSKFRELVGKYGLRKAYSGAY